MVETDAFKPSLKGLIIKDSLGKLGVWVIGIFVIIGRSLAWPILLLFLLILCLISVFYNYLKWKNISFVIKENGILIKRGIIAKSRSLLLYKEIQDVREKKSLFDKVLGLKSLEVVTFSPISATVGILSSLPEREANALKESIFSRIGSASKAGGVRAKALNTAATITGVSLKQATNAQALQVSDHEKEKLIDTPFKIQSGAYSKKLFFVGVALLALFGIPLTLFNPASMFLWLSIIFICLIIFTVIVVVYSVILRCNSYRIGAEFIQIEYNFIQQNLSNILFDRVQDILLRRGIIDRLAGLASLKVQTGEREIVSSSNQVEGVKNFIPALLLSDALKLRELLMTKIGLKGKQMAEPLVQRIPLEKRKVWKKSLKNTILIGVILLAISAYFAANLTFSQPVSDLSLASFFSKMLSMLPILALIVLVSFGLLLLYEWQYLKGYYYNLANDYLVIRKGVFTVSEIIVPFRLVQDIYLDQDVFDRAFGLYDVHVSTVTTISGLEAHIDGLSKENAHIIRDVLLEKIKASPNE